MALEKLAIVYHYAQSRHYESMREGNANYHFPDLKTGKWSASDTPRGLWPRSRFIPKGIKGMKRLPKRAYRPVSYALFSPEPQDWIENKMYPKAWWALMEYLGDNGGKNISLLEIDLCPTDEVYVVDANLIMPFIFDNPNDTETLRLYKERFRSMVSLTDYLSDEKIQERFILPEIIIQNPVPTDRIRRVWERTNQMVWKRGQELYQLHQWECA